LRTVCAAWPPPWPGGRGPPGPKTPRVGLVTPAFVGPCANGLGWTLGRVPDEEKTSGPGLRWIASSGRPGEKEKGPKGR